VEWRFSAPAGDVEESKLCLFSVIMPAKCVSSISPRFHYRRVSFCFLPLAAILEFLEVRFLKKGLENILLPGFYIIQGWIHNNFYLEETVLGNKVFGSNLPFYHIAEVVFCFPLGGMMS
jgi:hypothetical protein